MWLHRRAVHLLLFFAPVLGALLPTGAEAADGMPGVPCGTPALLKDIQPEQASASPGELVEAGGILYFVVNEGPRDNLWKSNGTEAGTVRLAPPAPWPDGMSVGNLTRVGSRVYFTVTWFPSSAQLWTSDGTDSGTQWLADFAGTGLDFTTPPVALGDTLYFVAEGQSDGRGVELWKSRGTPALTERVTDIATGPAPSRPEWLTPFAGKIYFTAYDDNGDKELWMTAANPKGAERVKDILEGVWPGNPTGLTVVGDTLFFTAVDVLNSNARLWKSRGSFETTELVWGPPGVGNNYSFLELATAGGRLFFTIEEPVGGEELWTSDGTEAGTVRVRDIAEGALDSAPLQLTAVGNTLFFTADDMRGEGRELWRSDGTEAGTRRAWEFIPGPGAPSTIELFAGPGVLLAKLDDDRWGTELWKVDETGAYRLTDLSPGKESSNPSEMTVAGGRLFFRAAHPAWGEELFVLPLSQVDCFAPRLMCPGEQLVEATSSDGATFTPPHGVFDDSVAGPVLSYTPPLTGRFPLGTTQLRVDASDASGNSTTCFIPVTVRDTSTPLLVCPEEVRQEATSANGTNVHYSVQVSDAVDRTLTPTWSLAPGSLFPMGETQVRVDVRDDANNPVGCDFKVYVQDTVRPRLTCPRDIVVWAMSAEPVRVTYEAEAEDAVTAPLVVEYAPPPDSLFQVGVTPVTVTTRDAANNLSTCTFRVNHFDPVPPTIRCPGPQQRVATGPEGARVDFEVVASDNLEGALPTVSYTLEPGSTFPVGETTVTATARDAWGHEASCDFTVTVAEEGGSGCGGCGAGSAGGSLAWLLLALAPLWARRRAARLGR